MNQYPIFAACFLTITSAIGNNISQKKNIMAITSAIGTTVPIATTIKVQNLAITSAKKL